MDSIPSEAWIVGFLYRVTKIGAVAVFLVLWPIWWLLSVWVGVLTAWNTEWSATERIVAFVVVGGVVIWVKRIVRGMIGNEMDWEVRLEAGIGIALVGYLLVSNWDWVGRKLGGYLSTWSVEWTTVERLLLGAAVATFLAFVGRAGCYCVAYLWKFIFWLITGERLNTKRL